MNHDQQAAAPVQLALATTQPTSQPATQPSSQPAKVYTCPMHPEVTSDKPGKCPKCGMKLQPEQEKPAEGGHEHGH
jgi:Cu+-exporting ATPase